MTPGKRTYNPIYVRLSMIVIVFSLTGLKGMTLIIRPKLSLSLGAFNVQGQVLRLV